MTNLITYTVKVYTDGAKYWCLNDELHREDGPAIEWANGTKHWFLNNELDREDGPAVELANGDKYWLLNGNELTEAEFNKKLKKPCNNKVVEIDGIKYRLTIVED